MTSEAPELLPCPFCGSENITTDAGFYYAACADCGVYAPCKHHPNDPVKEWNTRSDHALAMVAVEREACANIAREYHRKAEARMEIDPDDADRHEECASTAGSIEAAIRRRARTPDDARAALEAMLKAERMKATEELLRFVIDKRTAQHILALIEQENGK